ncbi:L,D-transpeptidase family protein [Clostridiaceae bacterium M8S5]|nr:L,D-transpeptidase family protein [Clostridiaceae bacterium M8S5]
MKKKICILLALIMLVSVGCKEKKALVTNVINKAAEKQNEEKKPDKQDDNKTEKEQEKPKEYYGQALSSSRKNGSVKVYEKPDNKSKAICSIKDLEMVKLLETVPYGWFKVEVDDNKIGYMDARRVRAEEIPPHKYSEKADGYNLVFTHSDQKLKIYKDGQLVKECLGSSGLWDYFTPKGVFELEKKRRGKWAYIDRFNMGFKYWVGFKGIYLFHSVPYNKKQELLVEEEKKLGEPASHGCIRLPVEIAKYIYENVPEGSKVLIY